MDHNLQLDLLKAYINHVYIPLKSAVTFGFHKSKLYPNITLTTTLWKEQIPTFTYFIETIDDDRYCLLRRTHYHQIALK